MRNSEHRCLFCCVLSAEAGGCLRRHVGKLNFFPADDATQGRNGELEVRAVAQDAFGAEGDAFFLAIRIAGSEGVFVGHAASGVMATQWSLSIWVYTSRLPMPLQKDDGGGAQQHDDGKDDVNKAFHQRSPLPVSKRSGATASRQPPRASRMRKTVNSFFMVNSSFV